MFYTRPGSERGHANFGWLDSHHSFSFGYYYDPKHLGLSALRVINDDTVSPGAGFDTHSHRDMEIVSYVLEGAIEHKDSMGNRFVVPAGDIQRMSAGTGISHSEYNHSKNEPLRFLQIWVKPNRVGTPPSYEQKKVPQQGPLTPLVTADGRDGSLSMQQDASLYRLRLSAGEGFSFNTQVRPGYLHVIEGDLDWDEGVVSSGDALGAHEESFSVNAKTDTTALWFDLPVAQ